MTAVEKVRRAAEKLSATERDELIDGLISAREVEHMANIARRIEEIDSGEIKGIPVEKVFAELDAKLEHGQ